MFTKADAAATSAVNSNGKVDLPEMKPEHLTVFSEIGNGRFKTVSSGCHSKHGSVAVLKYKSGSQNEAEILAVLRKRGPSAHVPEVYGFRKEQYGFILAQELSTFGSVRSVLQDEETAQIVTLQHKLHIAQQFAEAVSFLEAARVVHTDLACRNFLLFQLEDDAKRTNVKLTDFAFSLVLPSHACHVVRKLPQATRWCAPETVASNKWSCKTDVWSLGATLWELFADGAVPWIAYSKRADVAQSLRDLAQSHKDQSLDASADLSRVFTAPAPSRCPLAAHKALLSCLLVDAQARPTSKYLAAVFAEIAQAPAKTFGADEVPCAPSSPGVPRQSPCRAPSAPRVESTSPPVERRMTGPTVIMQPHAVCSVRPPLEPAHAYGVDSRLPSSSSLTQLTPAKPAQIFKSGSCFLTPPTRCPSTPDCASVQSSPDSAAPRMLVFQDELRRDTSQSSAKMSSSLNPQQQGTLESIKALCASPHAIQSTETLESIRAFLSSPEAVCGLGVEKQLALRRKLAAAETCQQGQGGKALSNCRVIYRDTIIPLVPLGGNRSLCCM